MLTQLLIRLLKQLSIQILGVNLNVKTVFNIQINIVVHPNIWYTL